MKVVVSLTVIILLQISSTALAVCHNSYVCDGTNCGNRQICDNSYDIPSAEAPPVPAIPTAEVMPLPSMDIPPIGTTHCRNMQVNGYWRNVCN